MAAEHQTTEWRLIADDPPSRAGLNPQDSIELGGFSGDPIQASLWRVKPAPPPAEEDDEIAELLAEIERLRAA